eukprot:Skav222601  [mRNA]  locus=scaffold5038:47809:55965:+ [translate_table: standard]
MALNIKEIIVQAIFETLVVPSRAPGRSGARDLPAADFGFGGGSSDPYVVVKVGTTSFTSVKRVKTLNPQAHAMDFLVYHMEQHLFVDVFDSDLLSKDDRLGYVVANGRRPRVNDLDELQDGCGSCFSDPGSYECPACGFKCCRTCWYDRRPAAAMLRVCLREGLVPKEDAKAGVRLGVCVEGGAPQWSSVSTRPTYEDLTEQSEAQRWIQNLCRRAVAQGVDFLGQEPVIWDHALHFLIRQPSPDMSLGVLYKSARGVCERQVPLSKKLHSGEPSATGSPMEV